MTYPLPDLREFALLLSVSLGITLIAECLLAFLLSLRGRDLLLVALVNFLTNPAVVYLYYLLRAVTPLPSGWIQIPLELGAIAAEGWVFRRKAPHISRPLMFSFLLNAFSYAVGLLWNRL